MSDLLASLRALLGDAGLRTGDDMAAWSHDWTGGYAWTPLCVARPRSTAEVSEVVRLAAATGVAVVPVSGNTGVSGGTYAEGAVMLSLDRMNRVEQIRPEARLAVVQAGVILSDLHAAAADKGLSFPMTFGARGSARIGGLLATNAGGSNVLRHGNTRDLVLGLEAVLADGRVVNLMSELHKNNTGYDLRHLLIGSEGTLGIITRAVLKLVPAPGARATAMVAVPFVSAALGVLNRLQDVTGGAVEAFEYMPASYLALYDRLHPDTRPPFDAEHEVNILVELAATAARDVAPGPDGQVPLAGYLEQVLGEMLEEGAVLDAVVARNEAQRAEMWARREAAAEVTYSRRPVMGCDVAVPLDKVQEFLERADAVVARMDPDGRLAVVAHLGDGNVHYCVQMGHDSAGHRQALMEAVEDVVVALGGSFSAEHGVGLVKRPSMARRKDPVALDMMRAIKRALDPDNILNPGKVVPD
ncbi:FAD-binding oxidoreductase [Maliponia aquimaris]|uniref:Putative FAD-linked oxidoreductase n=1 Tax=Maliponia aquimaris TaxID=1673631 RepID=A0A238K5X8_9RHOB|nr:FAD-binding oxidoreductase [Maliponia aquimaris]SMX38183.1 putative FAD-linked oxidoreductase [Maliponia aquimaris]